jgi:hypothetical protein
LRMKRFWNNLYQVRLKSIIGKLNLKSLGEIKQTSLNLRVLSIH